MPPRSQPQTVHEPSAIPQYDEETARLLSLWVELAWRVASSAAHSSADEASLWNQQRAVEDAITARVADSDALMAEMWAWESTLIHENQAAPTTCLLCRKARAQLVPGLPLPPSSGGRR